MANHLLLIDAYAMIYRAYYAFIRAPRMNSQGQNTSAVYGFVTTVEELLHKLKPTHIAVAFDPAGPTFRHEIYDRYKANREATPEDIRWSVPVIKDILHAMRITCLEVSGYEADDVVGTVAHMAEQAHFTVHMATPDKDYGQLVTEHVIQYRPRHTGGFEEMNPQTVCDKYGITTTKQVIDLLALMGDSSDNIPGCRGVGEKTAVQLLQQFGNVETLLDHTEQLKGALRTKVDSQKQEILFSKFLATIKTDVPIPNLNPDLSQLALQPRDQDALNAIYQELEFRSLMQKSKVESQKLKVEKELSFAQDFNTIENRLCAYLLNPEASFNPSVEPDWNALKRNPALWNLYQEVELPLVPVLRKMEQAGVRIDENILHRAEHELTAQLTLIEQQIGSIAGQTFNVNSPAQVGIVLFENLHLDSKAKRGKTGKYSTSEEVLLALKDKHPIVPLLLEQRELKKLISTYLSALPTYIRPDTGKIHTTYNQTTTATGRLSSSNPNLQNLPIRTARGQLIRQAVIPDEGCRFLSADYSQIELRLMAHLSGDRHMQETFRQGQDVHAATAAKIYHKPLDEVTKDERRKAKTANFGILYGISAFGLAQQLECSRSEAKTLIDDYFAAFPHVVEFIEKQKEFARNNGYVETLFGRRRYLPDILSGNATVRSFAERNAVNAPIQGTAADIIKMAMISIDQRLTAVHSHATMIMQVHDELNFNVPINEVVQVQQIVVEEMQNVVHLSVPLLVESGVGDNWLEAH